MWTLVFILFVEGTLESHVINTYETMYDCFDNREQLSIATGGSDGYFPPDMQAICVFRGEST
jgi:hypothetical protein